MIQAHLRQQRDESNDYQPVFYDLSQEKDHQALVALLEARPYIRINDNIYSQLRELMKIRNPTQKLTQEESDAKIQAYVGNTPLEQFGIWVYYPWSDRVVHLVNEVDFIELRTSRNQHKITAAEITLLSTKKVGIVGLSVGQSAALTIAMERTCGEIRLADFDNLELTNMNRIRCGVHNIQTNKVIIAAREIAEIDPYIRVKCYPDGMTENNLEDFFLEGGKLDLFVEECDSVDIKILSRIKAKELKIPVLMEMSDRGMLDIERFDLEPDRPLLHGLIPEVDISTLKGLTDAEKLPIFSPMLALDKVSSRMKFSLGEIGKTITTWPQLASAVVLGGAIIGDTCRRVLLDQLKSSGRYYIDFEQLIV
ncbi:ThiF family adenylyltransferase [Chitinophaga nivalis]|uniref:ThiF family adenylyltransferase n=1 Tax=Chitinophaga nivalis TaxID=2991709 RepID=A0ABT3IWU6_9BACT|nr:ThiF family adenylyltransferase [Chitinophaga nivalis]MCW3461850.1 ThiF family adenylyltransferase [Chitinophaga nivalis]MCW3488456.1 ThiF family adenylyltransferase [Chitinophaga nivalis]